MHRSIYIAFLFCFLFMSDLLAQGTVNELIIARNTGNKVLANLDTIRVFGFAQDLLDNPEVPGPTIYANEGDSVHLDLWNVSQGAPHTIHLHGLDVDQENDGVPHLSFEVGHMDHGYYNFKAPHAGTYLYHCHVASTIHVQAGMYGLIIIKPTNGSNTTWNGGYPFENDFSYLLSEIDTNWHTDSVLLHDHDTTMMPQPVHIPDFHPQFFLINGFSDQQLQAEGIEFNAAVGEVNYVRLSNIGYCGTRVIFPAGLNPKIIDSDGRPLPVEEISDTVYIYPGERYGVLATADAEFTSHIQFDYFDLNTSILKNTQLVPVNISGFAGTQEETSDFSFDIFPNPIDHNSVLQFNLEQNKTIEINIYDTRGRLIVSKAPSAFLEGNHSIQISEMISESGHFTIQLVVDGIPSTKKIIRI